MVCLVAFLSLLSIKYSESASVSEEIWDSLQALILDPHASDKKASVAVNAKGTGQSLMQKFKSKDKDGQKPGQAPARNQGFIDELKAEIQSLTSQLAKAENLRQATNKGKNASDDSKHAKQANKSVAALFRGHETRGKDSSKKAKSKGRYAPLEPSGVLGSNASQGDNATEGVEGQCAPGNAWWGRRLPEEQGFFMASCENFGWKTITTWCECKVAAEHVKILDKRIYAINSSCDGVNGCPNEPPGCYVKEGAVLFNPPTVWNVQSCATWTDWETSPNFGCLCQGHPTTTTTTTTLPCTDFSGYYRNKAKDTLALQQDDCDLTVTFQATTWTNGTELEGGWHLFGPSGPTRAEGKAGYAAIDILGTIGRGLDIQSNPNGTNFDGTVKKSYPFGKAVIEWDNEDIWTRTTCNIFNGTYSDGTKDWAIMQSACLVNVTGGDLGVNQENLGNYKIGTVIGNDITWNGKKGHLDMKLLKINWEDNSPSWSRGSIPYHSGKTDPPPE